MLVSERRGNLKLRSRENFKLPEKPRPQQKKCQKSIKNLCLVVAHLANLGCKVLDNRSRKKKKKKTPPTSRN